jgi:hypothetical protein
MPLNTNKTNIVPRVQREEDQSATGLLLRTHSAGPVSQICFYLKARAATRRRNPRLLDSTTQN